MNLDPATCEQARLSRDARFDGRFFVGVRTTGIYCRPICPVRAPRSENILFFSTAAAAAEAGFRPCLRCRPETSPGTPAWSGTNATVMRGMRLLSDGALDRTSLEDFAARLGVGTRHLNRLFVRHLGASPSAIARTRRLHYAKKLLDETDLAIAELAHAAGYRSVRRFNDEFRSCYGASPTSVRKRRMTEPVAAGTYRITMDFRPPYDWHGTLAFLAARATPGVEWVQDNTYGRAIRIGDEAGSFTVSPADSGNRLLCAVRTAQSGELVRVIEGVRRMFDVAADPREINEWLGRDESLAPLLAACPGMRIPGTWDGFETAVRAIVGQQVSVPGATTTTGKLARRFGEPVEVEGRAALLFPTPDALAELDPASAGMPRTKASAIRDLARAVVDGRVSFDRSMSAAELEQGLTEIRGIGPWTASYIALRFLGDPDALPHPDLVLIAMARKLLDLPRQHERRAAQALLARADEWRPWRAYAALHLWRAAAAANASP